MLPHQYGNHKMPTSNGGQRMPRYVHSLWQRKCLHSLVTICQNVDNIVLSFHEKLVTFDSTIQVFNPNLYTPTCTLQSSVSTAATVRCHRNVASYSVFCLGVILLCFHKCTTFQLIGCHSCYTTFWSTRPS